MLVFASPSKGGKKGGVHFGRLVKLLGNLAEEVDAIADAFNIAKGFFPVKEFAPPTRLLVPLVLVLALIAFDYNEESFPPGLMVSSFGFESLAILTASGLNYSILYSISLNISLDTVYIPFNQSLTYVNNLFF